MEKKHKTETKQWFIFTLLLYSVSILLPIWLNVELGSVLFFDIGFCIVTADVPVIAGSRRKCGRTDFSLVQTSYTIKFPVFQHSATVDLLLKFKTSFFCVWKIRLPLSMWQKEYFMTCCLRGHISSVGFKGDKYKIHFF